MENNLRLYTSLLFLFISVFINAQGVSVSEDGSDADPSAMLDVKSDNKGVLLPRLSQTEMFAITNPANGLSVFNTTVNAFYVYVANESLWTEVAFGTNTIPGAFVNCGDPVYDSRDGQTYSTVEIGTQCWMQENLNVGTMINVSSNQSNNGTIEKYCYNNDPANCDIYGGLYQWDEAMQYATTEGAQGICPDGWHIPTDSEWCTLENYVDAASISCSTTGWRGYNAGGNLKETSTSHWNPPNGGATNSSGYTAIPGGYKETSAAFSNLGNSAIFWSSTKNASSTWGRAVYYQHNLIARASYNQAYGFSARCIKD